MYSFWWKDRSHHDPQLQLAVQVLQQHVAYLQQKVMAERVPRVQLKLAGGLLKWGIPKTIGFKIKMV